MTELLSPATAPFAAAILLMLTIAAAEAVGIFVGASPSSALDQAFPDLGQDLGDAAPDGGDADGVGLLAWLGVGRVPLLIWLVLFLTTFGLSGYAVQAAAGVAFGAPLPAFLASLAAVVAALPANGLLTRLVARAVPRVESEVVSSESFVGRVALVVRGVAREGLAAEARVRDGYGRMHHVRIEPEPAGEPLEEGSEALILRRDGAVYRAVRNVDPALSPRR